MFGPRITTVFASRWKALWWAATILVTAYCSVPDADESAGNAPQRPAAADHPAKHPANPWAKDNN
jgi:hypothetical protein